MGQQTLQQIVDAEIARLGEGAAISAQVADGVVTLRGTAPSEMRRVLIEQELLRLPEVLDVHNHLQLPVPAGDIREKLLARLEQTDLVSTGLRIEEADGAVILSGETATWFDRDAVERLAWTLPGVHSVENRITLPPGAVEPDVDGAGNQLA